MKDKIALYLLFHSADESRFEKITSATTVKEAWDILEKVSTNSNCEAFLDTRVVVSTSSITNGSGVIRGRLVAASANRVFGYEPHDNSLLCFLVGVIFVSCLYEDGFVNRFMDNTIQVSRNNMVYFSAIPRDGIFEIDLSNSLTNESSIYVVSNKRDKLDLDYALLWHCRLEHISKKRIEKLHHDGLLDSSDLRAFEKCEVENQLGKTIKSLRSERGGEYMSQEFLDHLKDHGIIAHRNPPYTPQHNGDIHWSTVKNILKYLKNTKDMFLVYGEPISKYCDNTGAIAIANESGITKGARRFRAKVHYIREVIEYGNIKLEKVHTYDNLADPFTKALAFPKHSEHTRNIGMLPASSLM
nr:hypothetical protein [Tanacetum cinerariifolium]